jgi:hypothetical protein
MLPVTGGTAPARTTGRPSVSVVERKTGFTLVRKVERKIAE